MLLGRCELWLVSLLFCFAKAKKIGLFASTGVYSHDALMLRVGRLLASHGHDITYVQIRVFNFNRSLPLDEPGWRYSVLEEYTEESSGLIRWIQGQMWISTFPFDLEYAVKDPVAAAGIFKIYEQHLESCSRGLSRAGFFHGLTNQSFDLIVTDFVLNECMISLTMSFDAPVVFVSNYPITTGYRQFLHIPSPPSYVPSCLQSTSSYMTFKERVVNRLSYLVKEILTPYHWAKFQTVFDNAPGVNMGYLDYPNFETSTTLVYLNPYEFLLDMAKPISNRVKHIGCSRCIKEVEPLDLKEIGIGEISPDGIVLLTFGGTVSGERMPRHVLRLMLNALGSLNHTVIWQFGSDPDNIQTPSNVHLIGWLPLPRLLAHPSLKLLITHGGIQTVLEAQFRVPILLLPLHGDQKYNVRRVVDKGIAEMIQVRDLSESALKAKIHHVLDNSDRFMGNNRKLKAQIMDYKKLEALSGMQTDEFWYLWTLRHGSFLRANGRFFEQTYHGDFFDWQPDLLLSLLLFISLLISALGCSAANWSRVDKMVQCFRTKNCADEDDDVLAAKFLPAAIN